MSEIQLKSKLCKIIRRRLKTKNSLVTKCDIRLNELIMTDCFELLGKSKVWGSFLNSSQITKIVSFRNFVFVPNVVREELKGELNGELKGELRVNVNLNPALKGIIQDLSLCLTLLN